MAVRDWGRVEERLRARADGLRRTGPHPPRSVALVTAVASGVHAGDRRCADCRAAISLERLRAAPSAMRCVACQRAWEAG